MTVETINTRLLLRKQPKRPIISPNLKPYVTVSLLNSTSNVLSKKIYKKHKIIATAIRSGVDILNSYILSRSK